MGILLFRPPFSRTQCTPEHRVKLWQDRELRFLTYFTLWERFPTNGASSVESKTWFLVPKGWTQQTSDFDRPSRWKQQEFALVTWYETKMLLPDGSKESIYSLGVKITSQTNQSSRSSHRPIQCLGLHKCSHYKTLSCWARQNLASPLRSSDRNEYSADFKFHITSLITCIDLVNLFGLDSVLQFSYTQLQVAILIHKSLPSTPPCWVFFFSLSRGKNR